MVHRKDVVPVALSGDRGGHAFSEVVDHAVEIERDDAEQVVARASDRACFDRVGGEANPGRVEQRRESLGLAKIVEEARVGLRRLPADVRLHTAVIQNDREPPGARVAVRGKLREQRDRIRDVDEHVRENKGIEGIALAGKHGRSIVACLDDHDAILRSGCGANQLAGSAAEVEDAESSVIAATCVEKRADLR